MVAYLVLYAITVDISKLYDLTVAHIADIILEFATTTAAVEPFVDLVLAVEGSGYFGALVILAMGGEETQSLHVLDLHQFGVVKTVADVGKEAPMN